MSLIKRTLPKFLTIVIGSILLTACAQTTPDSQTPKFNLDNSISPSQANSRVGDRMVVCGKVIEAYHTRAVGGSPTFLNMDTSGKDNFNIVIWGKDRNNFSDFPEVLYDSRNLCVRGLIVSFQSVAEIQLRSPSQVLVIN
ncbi:MAG: DNA-binding protein [Dehalococcoidia bacterium]|nr:DNA-binding protein [Dehalococcoidia bacterium]